MKARLVRIGNSQGVRIPKTVIEECGFGSEVEMAVRGRTVVIAAAKAPREGWDEAFRAMAAAGDDAPLMPEGLSEESDRTEWTW